MPWPPHPSAPTWPVPFASFPSSAWERFPRKLCFLRPVPKLSDGTFEAELPEQRRPSRAWVPDQRIRRKLCLLRPVPKPSDGAFEAELPEQRRPSRAWAPDTHPPEALLPQACPEAVGRHVRSRASGAEAPKQSLGARKAELHGSGHPSRAWAPDHLCQGHLGARAPDQAPLRSGRLVGNGRRNRSRASGTEAPKRSLGARKDDGDGRTVNTRHSPASASLLDFLAFLAPWRSISIRAGNAKPAAPRGRGGSAPAQATGIRSS